MGFTRRSTLFGTLVRVDDSGSGPPWPMLLWNPLTHAWDVLGSGSSGSSGSSGGGAASLLVCLPSMTGVLADYLGAASGKAVLTAAGDAISVGALRVAEVPDFVQTGSGDVIGVPGR